MQTAELNQIQRILNKCKKIKLFWITKQIKIRVQTFDYKLNLCPSSTSRWTKTYSTKSVYQQRAVYAVHTTTNRLSATDTYKSTIPKKVIIEQKLQMPKTSKKKQKKSNNSIFNKWVNEVKQK